MNSLPSWQFWIDRGGTFTDIIGLAPDQTIRSAKLLSHNPNQYEDAALAGIQSLLDREKTATQIQSVRMGTTIATNALLERTGQRTALAITQGLRDCLEIGHQARPDIFALQIDKPSPLYSAVIEIEERMDATGNIQTPLKPERNEHALQSLYDKGYRALAIVFAHAHINSTHEKQIEVLARRIGFTDICCSHHVSTRIKMITRGLTAVMDAYLSQELNQYVHRVSTALNKNDDAPKLYFMQSSGGLCSADQFHARNAVLSGPAGGVIGAVHAAKQSGFSNIIGFDMGGTSTDVFHYSGQYERSEQTQISGVPIAVPMLEIHTIAAGGGSILGYDGHRFNVGPQSAGAQPGPACYGNHGPVSVSDLNVVLGKLNPQFFPSLFGPAADAPLDREASIKAITSLAKQCGKSLEETASGFLNIAIDHMARAISKISTQRGYDLKDYTLACFGGAGGQHACLVAEQLGIRSILIHPLAGVLCAYGIGMADITQIAQKRIDQDIYNCEPLLPLIKSLKQAAKTPLLRQDISDQNIEYEIRLDLRYHGSDQCLSLVIMEAENSVLAMALKIQFEQAHQTRYSFINPDQAIIIEAITVEAKGGGFNPDQAAQIQIGQKPKSKNNTASSAILTCKLYSKGKWHDAPLYERADLHAEQIITGPAIIIDNNGTNIIEQNWQAKLLADGQLQLQFQSIDEDIIDCTGQHLTTAEKPDPIKLEIYANLFMSIAENMGSVLQNTASSVNIKERLDFSCAVFDAQGGLVANAPHMPVHIGSMDASIRALIDAKLPTESGDSFIHNNPYNGGTHLPDINVITPVFGPDAQGQESLLFYVASRGHHADIGGLSPGSMSPLAMNIEQEGVCIDCRHLVKDGKFLDADIRHILSSAAYPARNIDQNIADLKAQIAANTKGAKALLDLCVRDGIHMVHAYMKFCQNNGEHHIRAAIKNIPDCQFTLRLDQDIADAGSCQIQVAIKTDQTKGTAIIDFTGTSPQRDDNFNAPIAVTHAAVLYVFRCLVGADIPLNAGCLRPLTIIVPEACMLRPQSPAAIVAGNVELSQAITNALFGAIGALGSSQSTMNNLTFGNDQYQYYETLCSGAPAGPSFDGAAAIHTHMTNSHLTDPEILEHRFPVRLERFEINRGSGGKGQYNAGDGIVRQIRFLEPMECAILSGNRKIASHGTKGGQQGQIGQNIHIEADGQEHQLDNCARLDMQVGDAIKIITPTGGGYGAKPKDKL